MPENDSFTEWLEAFYNNSHYCFNQQEEIEHYNNLIKLFNNPSILSQYKAGKANNLLLQAAMDFSSSINLDFPPLKTKLLFIDTCYTLFQNWFSLLPDYNECCFMFWDALIGRPDYNNNLSEDEKIIYESIYDCLTRILALNNKQCQLSALHGFNHLKDKRIQNLLEVYIKSCKDPELIKYARQAAQNCCL